ncbi:MAG: hypothetical protein KGL59_15510 [Acidobacteriota bacterium]|nr:hypothetical protein [Acidobacteriota bacterium]
MRFSLLLAILVMAVHPAAAQNLLPTHFAGWQTVPGSVATATLDTLPPENAALFRACHEQSAERRSYQKNGQTIAVTLYWMGDPSYGYSVYSLLRPQPATDYRPSPHSAIGPGEAMILVGNLLADVTGKNLPAYAHDFSALVAAIQPHASSEPYPSIWQYLPSAHFVAHTDRYALDLETLSRALNEVSGRAWPSGDWLGFDDEVEAEVATYDVAGRKLTLMLASYPTQQVAAEHVKNMEQLFVINPEPGAQTNARPVLYARRIGSIVGFVSGAQDAKEANLLLREIRYQTVVTWNEPGFKLTDLTMADYVVGAVLGTMTLLLISLVVGVALGFIRVGIKRMLPGVVFDRRRSIEIIQLGLSSKPIDPTDFY